MNTNQRLDRLGDSSFTRMTALLEGTPPRAGMKILPLTVGEPQHAAPSFLAETIAANAHLWNFYPPVQGTPAYRNSVATWLTRRYALPAGLVDPDRHVLALAGTKEGLYLMSQVAIPETKAGRQPVLLTPNPFYQVYVGSGVMAGAETIPMTANAKTGFLPDFSALPADVLERTAFAFLCTPSNPQGAIASLDYLKQAILLARRYDFVLAVDECYSELYDAEPPPGALQAAAELGDGFNNLLVFHSLSKRSNAAGLRAGFVAGDETLLKKLYTLRTYAGSQIPLPVQAAAVALWSDEDHVVANRAMYRKKIDAAARVLGDRYGFYRPQGGFFLWLDVKNGVDVAYRLWRDAAVRVLPGEYLAWEDESGQNPGSPYIRVALVHDEATVAEALERMIQIV